jgi:hypothetical protein
VALPAARRRGPGDVQVTNATPEPDGTHRAYWLRVPPGMRTARQAVAWTFDLDEEVDRRFLVLAAQAILTHPEHASITLPAGSYQVRRQREYTPEAVRPVAD